MTDGLWKSNQKTLTNYYIFISVGLLIIVYYFFEAFWKKAFKEKTKNRIIFFSSLFIALWAWSYGVTYYNHEHPVTQAQLDKDRDAQSSQNIIVALYTLTIPLLLFLPMLMLFFRGLGATTWSFSGILYSAVICCVLGYATLGAIYTLDYTIKESQGFPLSGLGLDDNKVRNMYENSWLWLSIFSGLSFTLAFIFAILKYRKLGGNWVNWAIGGLLAIGLILLLALALGYAAHISQNNYTTYLITTGFLIFGFLIISLLSLLNRVEFQKGDIFNYIPLIFSSLAFILSTINWGGSCTQTINNSEGFGDFTHDGKKIGDYNDSNYGLLNFSMAYNYFALMLITGIITVYLGLEAFGDNLKDTLGDKPREKFLKLFSFNNKVYSSRWLFVFGVLITIFTIVSAYAGTKGWEDLKIPNQGGYVLASVPGSLILLTIIFEIINSYREKGKENTFMDTLYKYIIIGSLVFIPIISLLIYSIKTPKFFTKINDTGNSLMIFGDTNSKNGVPLNDAGDSQFSVSSNFSYYGNGIFFSGGRTNLDLETTRGIRYVSSQSHYFNLKYLYNFNQDFREIDRGDGLNIFSLETNDISYGIKNVGTDAYLVAVGENVGLTDSDNSTIFYNTLAGTNSTEIPLVEDLNNWKKADSNAFDFKGNGVTSGFVGSANRWVAVGQNSVDFSDTVTIKYSNDGKNWTNSSGSAFSEYGNKVVFSPSGLKVDNTYIAVGAGGNNILRSTDGINWSTTTGTSLFSIEATDVAFGMNTAGTTGIWVAVGRDASNPIRYSTDDGQTWSNADNTTYSFSKPDDVNAVSYNLNDGYFYAVGREVSGDSPVYRSNDGLNWSKYDYDFLEATSVASNLTLAKSNSRFNNIYYPAKDYQQFFIDKISSKPLTLFLFFTYISTFVIIILTLFLMYRKSKKINS